MYCPKKRKEYLAAALAATAASTIISAIVTSSTETTVPLVVETESIADGASATSSSSQSLVRALEFFEVSPTYEALLRGELQQQRVLDDMLAKVRPPSSVLSPTFLDSVQSFTLQ